MKAYTHLTQAETDDLNDFINEELEALGIPFKGTTKRFANGRAMKNGRIAMPVIPDKWLNRMKARHENAGRNFDDVFSSRFPQVKLEEVLPEDFPQSDNENIPFN